MADTKISALTTAGAAISTDIIPVARSGTGPLGLTVANLHNNPTFTGILKCAGGGEQSNASIAARSGNSNSLEWGHANGAGYGSTLGYNLGSGAAFLAFHAESSTNNTAFRTRGIKGSVIKSDLNGGFYFNTLATATLDNQTDTLLAALLTGGQFGLGMVPTQQLELSGSIGQKATGTTWSNPSDSRLKENIVPADLARCYEIVKSLPLRHYRLRREAFDDKQAVDRSKLGWVAQEVQPHFSKSVITHKFSYAPVDDGVEVVEEPILEEASQGEENYLEIISGVPTLKTRQRPPKVAHDMVPVVNESGTPVVDDEGEPLLAAVPRMRKVLKPKKRQDTIPDCLALDADQIYAAMFGAIQMLMQKVEALEKKVK